MMDRRIPNTSQRLRKLPDAVSRSHNFKQEYQQRVCSKSGLNSDLGGKIPAAIHSYVQRDEVNLGDSFNMIGFKGAAKQSKDRAPGSQNKHSKTGGKLFSKLQNIHSKDAFDQMGRIQQAALDESRSSKYQKSAHTSFSQYP